MVVFLLSVISTAIVFLFLVIPNVVFSFLYFFYNNFFKFLCIVSSVATGFSSVSIFEIFVLLCSKDNPQGLVL